MKNDKISVSDRRWAKPVTIFAMLIGVLAISVPLAYAADPPFERDTWVYLKNMTPYTLCVDPPVVAAFDGGGVDPDNPSGKPVQSFIGDSSRFCISPWTRLTKLYAIDRGEWNDTTIYNYQVSVSVLRAGALEALGNLVQQTDHTGSSESSGISADATPTLYSGTEGFTIKYAWECFPETSSLDGLGLLLQCDIDDLTVPLTRPPFNEIVYGIEYVGPSGGSEPSTALIRDTTSPDKLNVLAYNIFGIDLSAVADAINAELAPLDILPRDFLNSPGIPTRWQKVPAVVNDDYDVIIWSEAFGNDERDLLMQELTTYGYQNTDVVDDSQYLEDGGVFISSRFPIESQQQLVYANSFAEDGTSAKGALYAKINKGGTIYHVFGTHLQATTTIPCDIPADAGLNVIIAGVINELDPLLASLAVDVLNYAGQAEDVCKQQSADVRQLQFQQLNTFIEGLGIPPNEPIIIGGDLNVDRFDTGPTRLTPGYPEMLTALKAKDFFDTRPPQDVSSEYSADPVTNEILACCSPDTSTGDFARTGSDTNAANQELLDYVLYRDQETFPSTPNTGLAAIVPWPSSVGRVMIFKDSSGPMWSPEAEVWGELSDHYPIYAYFDYTFVAGNDAFSDAYIVGTGPATLGTLEGATDDGGTSGAGNDQPDVWYSYTPPSAGTVSVNTCGSQNLSGIDTVLSVHTDDGTPGIDYNQLALNNDWNGAGGDPNASCPGGLDSAVSVSVNAGTELTIRVSRFALGEPMQFSLQLSFTTAGDDFANPIPTGGLGTLEGATNDGTSSFDPTGSEPDVWYSFTASAVGRLSVKTCGSQNLSGIDTVLSVHTDDGGPGTAANELALNDNWNEVDGDPFGCSEDSNDSALLIDVENGQDVLIRVSQSSTSTLGRFVLILQFTRGNDSFYDAVPVGNGTFSGTMDIASGDGSNTIDFGKADDVWYSYIAPAAGILKVDTCGSQDLSGINTILSVHTDDGGPGTTANQLVVNDDGVGGDPVVCGPEDSAVVLQVNAFDELLIRISSFSNPNDFVLNVSLTAANDAYEFAVSIDSETTLGFLSGASIDGGTSGAGNDQPDVWYLYTAPNAGTLSVNTCGSENISGIDTVLSVHTDGGGPGTAANELALNDNWTEAGGNPDASCPGGLDSALLLAVDSGQNLLIRVSQSSSSTPGEFYLNVSYYVEMPINDDFDQAIAIAITIDGESIPGSSNGATSDGTSSYDQTDAEPDVWYVIDIPLTGTLHLNTCGTFVNSGLNTILSIHPNTGTPGTVGNQLAVNANHDGADPSYCAATSALDAAIVYPVSEGDSLLVQVSWFDSPVDGDFIFYAALEPLNSDSDEIPDFIDNCTEVSNTDQRDTDGDGFGNACDPDLNNDGIVNFIDISEWAPFFNTATTGDADFNGDGVANFLDYSIFPDYFLQSPGPSGIAP